MSHILWILLIIGNLIIQLAYFRKPSAGLFLAKRITTPAMLFGALIVILVTTGEFPLVEGIILLAMGLGELGIEGSRVVESKGEDAPSQTPWTVTAAGILFMLVNIGIGMILLIRYAHIAGILIGLSGILCMVILLCRIHAPDETVTFQLRIYAVGLAILAAGALSALFRGPGALGIAGSILMVSDSLVLWRMGAGWDKQDPSGRKKLLSFLTVILLLYYGYIAVLIQGVSPFTI